MSELVDRARVLRSILKACELSYRIEGHIAEMINERSLASRVGAVGAWRQYDIALEEANKQLALTHQQIGILITEAYREEKQ